MTLRSGYTTGSCATAAAKAAAIGLSKGNIPDEVEIDTSTGTKLRLKILTNNYPIILQDVLFKRTQGTTLM